VSIASNIVTTSCISGRLSGFAFQHFRMMFAKSLGQFFGILGRKRCARKYDHEHYIRRIFCENKANYFQKEI